MGTALSAAEISQAMTDPLPLPSSNSLAPSIPSAVEATAVSTSQIDVTWADSADDVGVAGYGVHRDGVQVATVTTTSYSDGGLAHSDCICSTRSWPSTRRATYQPRPRPRR